MKSCTKCEKDLPLDSFDILQGGQYGRNSVCKQCRKQARHSKSGVVKVMYAAQKKKSKERGYTPPNYTEAELYTWLIGQPLFHELYQGWVESNYQSRFKPSCDRINDYISYRLDNLRMVTWNENNQKNYSSRMDGNNLKKNVAVDMLTLDGGFIQRFHSLSEAARQVNGRHANIWGAINHSVVKNKNKDGSVSLVTRTTAYGHKWRYSIVPNDNTEIV